MDKIDPKNSNGFEIFHLSSIVMSKSRADLIIFFIDESLN
jgi:hypothetical protein